MPPHPAAPPAPSPALLIPAQASRPKTPPSFSASLRIFASARPQTLRKPRQPAARTASATCPARLAAPAPRPPEPVTSAPRTASAPIAAHVLIASSSRCRRPSSRRAARLARQRLQCRSYGPPLAAWTAARMDHRSRVARVDRRSVDRRSCCARAAPVWHRHLRGPPLVCVGRRSCAWATARVGRRSCVGRRLVGAKGCSVK